MGHSRVGLIVNPVAGLGGRVGLKGSDGTDIQARAMALGAAPEAPRRAALALERLQGLEDLEILTYPAEMGEDVARGCGMEPIVLGVIRPGETTAQDTRDAARLLVGRGVDLLLFAGGDGTARDVYEALGLGQPVLGIPAGVKIHSAVYATNPRAAGELAWLYLTGRAREVHDSEVMDIDEASYRQGVLSARLYGYLRVPYRTQLVQSQKVPSQKDSSSLASIAADVAEGTRPGAAYIVGPGTTTRAILDALGLEKTLLGVDVVQDGRLTARDANEAQLLALLEGRRRGGTWIVVAPIGGQGYLFGRGNQQISPPVIEMVGRENLLIVCTPDKLHALGKRPLLVDTGDRRIDEMLSGYVQVVTGYRERAVRRVAC